jgi:hypothetical protein
MGGLVECRLGSRRIEGGKLISSTRCGKRQMLCLEILWNWMDGVA